MEKKVDFERQIFLFKLYTIVPWFPFSGSFALVLCFIAGHYRTVHGEVLCLVCMASGAFVCYLRTRLSLYKLLDLWTDKYYLGMSLDYFPDDRVSSLLLYLWATKVLWNAAARAGSERGYKRYKKIWDGITTPRPKGLGLVATDYDAESFLESYRADLPESILEAQLGPQLSAYPSLSNRNQQEVTT